MDGGWIERIEKYMKKKMDGWMDKKIDEWLVGWIENI